MPKKRFGQHFLSDPGILGRIVAFSRIGPDATVVEIGPGRGELTRRLAERARRVIAIEIDRDLIPALRAALPAHVEVIEADALGIDFTGVAGGRYDLVANLPYNVATPLLQRFVAARAAIDSVTILLQQEVADRILARPGTRQYGPLSVGVQYYAEVERGFIVPPGAFFPPPQVDSRLIRLTWRAGVAAAPGFEDFARRAFAARRKTLANNLAAMPPGLSRTTAVELVAGLGLPPGARPEDLTVGQFKELYDAVRSDA